MNFGARQLRRVIGQSCGTTPGIVAYLSCASFVIQLPVIFMQDPGTSFLIIPDLAGTSC